VTSEEGPGRTERLWRQAQGSLASGLWSITQGKLRYPDGVFPLLAESGEGCRLVDTSGRSYIDWMMGWGTSVLGYRNPDVERAIIDQLRSSGPLLSLLHPIEAEVARLIRELVPCAEAVAFGKNGSDALGGAVRIARAATGRDGILVCGFHGFQDWYMASQPWCEGIPDSLRKLVTFFPYNDLDALKALFAEHGARIAAVVMEPTNTALPSPNYLRGVRELTFDHQALLIFDEVVTGFRLARGGAQEAFGVTPDLACLGKAMGNGMPLSALVGKREVLEVIPRTGYGMTYRGEMLSLAAARACLQLIRDEPVTEHLAAVGDAVRAGFGDACQRAGVPGSLVGPSARMTISFEAAGGITPLGLQTLLIQECLARGVMTNGLVLPCWAHDDEAVAVTVRAFAESAEVLARAIDSGGVRDHLHMPAIRFYPGDEALEERDQR